MSQAFSSPKLGGRTTWSIFLGTLALLFVAVLLIPRMSEYSLWYDEVMVFNAADALESPADLYHIEDQPARIVHPPLFFVLLRVWMQVVGETDFALRALPAVIALLGTAFIYRTAVDLSGHYTAGIISAVAFGSMGIVAYYTHMVHNYSLLLATSAMTLFFYCRWWTYPGRLYSACLTLSMAVLLYTHYFGLFVILALNAHALLTQKRRRLIQWFQMEFIVAILYLPWFPIIYWLAWGGYVNSSEFVQVTATSGASVIDNLRLLFYDGPGIYAGAILIGLIVIFLRPIRTKQQPANIISWLTVFAVFGLLFPLIGNHLAQTFSARRVIYVVIPVVLLLGYAGVHLPMIARWIALAVFLLLTPNVPLHTRLPGNWFYRQAVDKVAEQARPGDAIVINFNNWLETPVFKHYAAHLLRPDMPSLFPGNNHLDDILWPRNRVWGIWPEGFPITWDDSLAQRAFTGTEQAQLGNIHVSLYTTSAIDSMGSPTTLYNNPAQITLPQTFGDMFELTAYRINRLTAAPGEQINLWLDWITLRQVNEDWGFFVHLIEDDLVTLHGQVDGTPSHLGRPLPTHFWPVGTAIYDHYSLTVDPDTPPGCYNLRIGIYSYQETLRLSVSPGDESVADDGLIIGRIEVTVQTDARHD